METATQVIVYYTPAPTPTCTPIPSYTPLPIDIVDGVSNMYQAVSIPFIKLGGYAILLSLGLYACIKLFKLLTSFR